jgi:hypothetical protein
MNANSYLVMTVVTIGFRSSNANIVLHPHTKSCQQSGTIDVAGCNKLQLILYELVQGGDAGNMYLPSHYQQRPAAGGHTTTETIAQLACHISGWLTMYKHQQYLRNMSLLPQPVNLILTVS